MTPTAIIPIATATPEVISSLTELEVKEAILTDENGGSLTEDDLTVEVSGEALDKDCELEIAKININGMISSSGTTEIYKISSGNKDDDTELKEDATVRIKADSQGIPMMWNGFEWLPVEYSYDSANQEIILHIDSLEEDDNEWINYGDDEASIEGPIALSIGTRTDYPKSLTSGKFKVFYSTDDDEDYARSVAKILKEAYDYYTILGYKSPVTSIMASKETSDYIYTYVFSAKAHPEYEHDSRGLAWTVGYIAFNSDLVKLDEPLGKSTCYHELLHLIQYSYSGRKTYPRWFSESMTTCMQYYAVNRPTEKYDLPDGRWKTDLLSNEVFNVLCNKSVDDYNKYFIWSYMVKKSDIKLFHNIMTDFKPGDNAQKLNSAFKNKFTRDLPTLYNELVEDYYVDGKFFNSTYFNKLDTRNENQPYGYIIRTASKVPENSENSYSVAPLGAKYVCYGGGTFKGSINLTFSDISSNCRIVMVPMKYDSETYVTGQKVVINGVNSVQNVNNFGTDVTNLLILIENTSISSDGDVTIKTKVTESEIRFTIFNKSKKVISLNTKIDKVKKS